MLKNRIAGVISLFLLVSLFACESADDISNGMDHEVPSYNVLTDSLIVQPGQTVELKVEVSDNAGLEKLVFYYSEWNLRQSVSLIDQNYPKAYTFVTSLTIPEDAEKEWIEKQVLKDGSTINVVQDYHKLTLEATDMNMNVRNIPVYLKVE